MVEVFNAAQRVFTLLLIAVFLASCSSLPWRNNLDAQSSRIFNLEPLAPPPLVLQDPHKNKTRDVARNENIWQFLRSGMSLRKLDSERVKQYLNQYSKNPHIVEHVLERSRPYIRYIADELNKNNMPLEIALLPAVESGYNPRAVSSSNAKGLWQFISGTGRYYRLAQNADYDGRLDVVASTNAAINYLGDLNTELDGDWILSLAAYNSGLGAVKRAIRRNSSQKMGTEFEDLILRQETSNYVPKLLAFSEIVKHPEKYGVQLPDIEYERQVIPIKLDKRVALKAVAQATGVDEKQLADLNPGYLSGITQAKHQQFLLAPVKAEKKIITALSGPVEKPQLNVAVAAASMDVGRIKIKRGDYLGKIAKRYGTTVAALKHANNLKSDLIIAGNDLIIPGYTINPDAGTVKVARESSLRKAPQSITHMKPTLPTKIIVAEAATQKEKLPPNKTVVKRSSENPPQAQLTTREGKSQGTSAKEQVLYRVGQGDTLWAISKHYRVAMRQIRKWNGLTPRTELSPGQTLKIYPPI